MQRRVVNLTFHGIGEPGGHVPASEWPYWIDEERFTAILDVVAGREDVRLSFDDGNESDVRIALPALRARGLRATFFVVAGRLGTPGYLAAADVGTLARAGMTVGTHGMAHRPWRRLSDVDQRAELVAARAVLEGAAGHAVNRAACPFGAYDRRSLAGLRRAGYAHVFTSDCGPADTDGWLQPRNTVARDDTPATVECMLERGRPRLRRLVMTVKRWR